MKRLEREHITNYRWWRPNGEDIRPEHVGALDGAAMARVAEMTAKGYTSGELYEEVRVDDNDGDGVTYRGRWAVCFVETGGGTRSTE